MLYLITYQVFADDIRNSTPVMTTYGGEVVDFILGWNFAERKEREKAEASGRQDCNMTRRGAKTMVVLLAKSLGQEDYNELQESIL